VLVLMRLVDRLNVVPSQECRNQRRMLFTPEIAMNFVLKDNCIDVDSALLRLMSRVLTRHVY
jgi:hypothetical protein